MTAHQRDLPLSVRLLNTAGRGVNALGIRPVSLELHNLLDRACANTGLSDFGDDDFREPLALLLDCLENEAKLSLMGRLVARADLMRCVKVAKANAWVVVAPKGKVVVVMNVILPWIIMNSCMVYKGGTAKLVFFPLKRIGIVWRTVSWVGCLPRLRWLLFKHC